MEAHNETHDMISPNNRLPVAPHPFLRRNPAHDQQQTLYRSISWAAVVSSLLLMWTINLVSGQERKDLSAATSAERRISDVFTRYNMSIKSIGELPDHPTGDIYYVVKDVFTTVEGSWTPSPDEASIPQWAVESYQSDSFIEAHSKQHLFAAVIGLDGQFLKNHEIRLWSDGFNKLGDATYTGYVNEVTKESSGWANYTLWNSSAFNPDQGMTGPWCWMPTGVSEVVCGGGLPYGKNISTFVVWQAVQAGTETPTPTEHTPTPTAATVTPTDADPDSTPRPTEPSPTPGKTATITVTQRFGTWIDDFRLEVKTFAERPDAERENHAAEEIVYVLKDLFSTRDGQWDPSDIPGSVDQWARDEYLKPIGAPDYFDDAGADHHLFAAVFGLDGRLITETKISYWSDGYAMLGDPDYDSYAAQPTKERSGWANAVMSESSSYVPERGEQGPWCWMPPGASDVICGGGLPQKWHVSFFAVWQAVKRSDFRSPGSEPSDFSVFLPFVSR